MSRVYGADLELLAKTDGFERFVGPAWVDACHRNGKWEDEERYLLKGGTH